MKITPLEIRQKSFEKNFRGYEKEEVKKYLNSLAEELETLIEEKKDVQRKLDQSEKEGAKLKQVEESLFRTLKTAEDTGASIIEEANQAADHILREAHKNAEAMYNDAQSQSQNLIKTAEAKGKEIMENLKNDVNAMVNSYETLIQQRELLLRNLKKLAEDINDNITVSQSDFKKVKIQAHAQLVEDLNKSNAFSMAKANEAQKTALARQDREEEIREELKKEAEEVQAEEAKVEEVVPETIVSEVVVPETVVENITNDPEQVGELKSLQSKAQEALQNFGSKGSPSKEIPAASSPAEDRKNQQGGSFFDQLD